MDGGCQWLLERARWTYERVFMGAHPGRDMQSSLWVEERAERGEREERTRHYGGVGRCIQKPLEQNPTRY